VYAEIQVINDGDSMKRYDVIVIGLGVMGGAAAYHCAKRGASVLGLDANSPEHTLGSSHGNTRAIRETYFEAPDYVPLIQRSYDLWNELEKNVGKSLLSISGAVYLGPEGNKLTEGIVKAAIEYDLPYERLSRKHIRDRHPGFLVPEGWDAVYERRGGVLQAPACQQAHLHLAKESGADLRFASPAINWCRKNGKVVVQTESEQFTADKLILTLGPWACDAFSEFDLPFSGRRIVIVQFEPNDTRAFSPNDMSVFFWATPEGIYAGFPYFEQDGIRIMRHDTGDVCTPESVNRAVNKQDVEQVVRFTDKYMPDANNGIRESNLGLYTMTPDNHFVIDFHPSIPEAVIAGGFSGHGFKFAPVVGEALADLALDGGTNHAIEFLSASRFENGSAAISA